MWRHNGYFDDFFCATLTSTIFERFSSNWHLMGLQTSVFCQFLQSNMADQIRENDRWNKTFRKTENKISYRVGFVSLITNMALFRVSVA